MSTLKSASTKEIVVGNSTIFQTRIFIQEVSAPANTVEIRVETVFASAKDPQARHKKAQFFFTRTDLAHLRDSITTFLDQANSEPTGE